MAGGLTVDYAALDLYDSPATKVHARTRGIFYGTIYYVSQRPRSASTSRQAPASGASTAGACRPAGALLIDLDAGDHTVDYTVIGGDYAPLASETVSLSCASNARSRPSYALQARAVTGRTDARRRPSGESTVARGWPAARRPRTSCPAFTPIDYAALAVCGTGCGIRHARRRSVAHAHAQLRPARATHRLATPTSGQWRGDAGPGSPVARPPLDLGTGGTRSRIKRSRYITPNAETVTLAGGRPRSRALTLRCVVECFPDAEGSAQWRTMRRVARTPAPR